MAAATMNNEQKRRRNRGDVNVWSDVIDFSLYRLCMDVGLKLMLY
jgi:hypothetical protein